MSKLTRVFQKQFGVNAGNSDVGIFGSLAASNPQYSKDPKTIQSLNAFLTGWAAETIANNRPALEDFNALDFLAFYQLCYLFQSGVPEWDASTTYYTGSIVNNGAGVLYKSLVDSNLNNAVTDGTKWAKMLGTAAALDVGTGANQIVQLDASAKLPAVDGSALTNLTGANVLTPLGDWNASAAPGTVYQAATDLIIIATTGGGSVTHTLTGYTDASKNPPTTEVAKIHVNGDVGNLLCCTFPVKKGHYWKVSTDANVIYRIPIGS